MPLSHASSGCRALIRKSSHFSRSPNQPICTCLSTAPKKLCKLTTSIKEKLNKKGVKGRMSEAMLNKLQWKHADGWIKGWTMEVNIIFALGKVIQIDMHKGNEVRCTCGTWWKFRLAWGTLGIEPGSRSQCCTFELLPKAAKQRLFGKDQRCKLLLIKFQEWPFLV